MGLYQTFLFAVKGSESVLGYPILGKHLKMPHGHNSKVNPKSKELDVKDGKQNESGPCFLLERLPAEIRDQIWTYVLGNRIIHFHHGIGMRRPQWSHRLCPAGSPEDVYTQTLAQPDNEERPYQNGAFPILFRSPYTHEPPARDRAQVCYCNDPRNSGTWPRLAKEKISLSLLYTCRQIHFEVEPILWKTNAFSFNTQRASSYFAARCSVEQLSAVLKLYLDMAPSTLQDRISQEWGAWTPLVASFPNVQSLAIRLTQSLTPVHFQFYEPALMKSLDQLAIMPLKKVFVVVVNKEPLSVHALRRFRAAGLGRPRLQLTPEERDDLAEKIRLRIMCG